MKRSTLLLGIHCHLPPGTTDSEFQQAAQTVYAPLFKLLADNPRTKCSLRVSGILFDHWAKQQTELLIELTKLVKRGQIELLSGGYYEPILALIPDDDKTGQINQANEYIKANFGLAPQGLWLAGRTWEPNLTKIIARAGIEYLLIDEEHFISAGADPESFNGYFVTEDEGEILKVFPVNRRIAEVEPETDKTTILAVEAEEPGIISQIEKIIKLPSSTFGEYLEDATSLGRIYLPTTGISAKAEEYFRNFLVKYPEANNLHKKMLFVSNKLKTAEQGKSLFGGIKLDRARQELYLGQNGQAYLEKFFAGNLRQALYHHLILAEREIEKLRRAGKPYVELALTDFDKDGEDEVVLTNDLLALYFSPKLGGSLFELDYKHRAVNLANTLGREGEFFHPRFSLLDHFLAPGTTLAEFSDSGYGEAGDFVQGRYTFMPARKESEVGLRLSRSGEVQGSPVKVEKNIVLHVKQSLFLVEYEVTNLGEEPDEFWFGSEFNFSQLQSTRGETEAIKELKIIDEAKSFAVSLETDRPAQFWRWPIEYQKNYQSLVVFPNWRFRLGPKEAWRGKISLRIEE